MTKCKKTISWLGGLISSDGCVYVKYKKEDPTIIDGVHVTYSNINIDWLEFVKVKLETELGLTCRIYKRKPESGKKDAHLWIYPSVKVWWIFRKHKEWLIPYKWKKLDDVYSNIRKGRVMSMIRTLNGEDTRITKICPVCGNKFRVVYANADRVCCSKKCGYFRMTKYTDEKHVKEREQAREKRIIKQRFGL
jgi:endogenous inhibitor of DNA gyrase (YacG/DUF329 family)